MRRGVPSVRRTALALAFAALFFAGAALSASAGDGEGRLRGEPAEPVTNADDSSALPAQPAPDPPSDSEETPHTAPAQDVPWVPVPAESPEPAPADDVRPASSSWAAPILDEGWDAPAGPESTANTKVNPKPRPQASVTQEAAAHGGAALVWLDRRLPDPTPPARRLAPAFMAELVRSADAADADWALVLGIFRAQGYRGRVPAGPAALRSLAHRLHATGHQGDDRAAALAVTGSTELADKAAALARYNRAVGRDALVRGLAAEKTLMVERLLRDRRIEIYPGGREDLVLGRIDVRVVALIAYLAESFGQVTVTSLSSGHRLYARPGVVSAHVYGRAVDIAALAGLSITGHQEPGGLTEDAVRSILLLPAELQPRQVISLLGLGGPSFPLADHSDHIHVGY